MHKKTLIPYLRLDYNKFVEDFQLQKIRSMKKEELLDHLKNSESWIYDCYLREKCINLFQKTGGFIGIGLSDDDLYKIGVEATIYQLNKRYFFDLNSDCHLLILNKVKSRVVNNIRNYFSSTRKVNYQQFQNQIIQIEDSDDTFGKIALEIDLEKIDTETLKNGLKKVWEDAVGDMDFDLKDFEKLCSRFGFNSIDVLIYDPWIVPQMSKKACNNGSYQLVLVFDKKEVM